MVRPNWVRRRRPVEVSAARPLEYGVRRVENHNSAAASPRTGLYRPIFTQFSAEARRVARDHAGPFCTMTVRLARDFCDNWSRNLRGLPRRRFVSTLG